MTRAYRTLHVDREAHPSRDGARSLEEALARLIADDYGTIVLHTGTPGRDDYGRSRRGGAGIDTNQQRRRAPKRRGEGRRR